jgi:hypothetical protein
MDVLSNIVLEKIFNKIKIYIFVYLRLITA